MNTTDNFDLKVYEGDDLFNPLTVENANTEAIDEQLFKNQNAGVQIATELLTQNVHAITRNVPDASVFRFTAVSRFTAGDVFEVDGVQVTALTTSGEQLPDGAYVIGSEVLCVLKGTVLTVFISTSSVNTAKNAEKLGGQLPAHYATAGDLADVAQIAQSAGELAEANTQEITTIKENSVITRKTYQLDISDNTAATPYTKFGEYDVTSEVALYGNVISMSAKNDHTVPCPCSLTNDKIQVVSTRSRIYLTVTYAKNLA